MEIEFIDQTLRDGQQSLWGIRMRAHHATPALPYLARTGFSTHDLTGGTFFVVMLRESGDDPWASLDHFVKNLPGAGHRAGMRPVAVGSFGFVPDEMLDLWVGTLVKHGIDSHWLFDCLYDMPLMKAKAAAIQRVGGEVVPAIMYGLTDLHTDEFFADRAREMASWDGVKRIYIEDAPGVLTCGHRSEPNPQAEARPAPGAPASSNPQGGAARPESSGRAAPAPATPR